VKGSQKVWKKFKRIGDRSKKTDEKIDNLAKRVSLGWKMHYALDLEETNLRGREGMSRGAKIDCFLCSMLWTWKNPTDVVCLLCLF